MQGGTAQNARRAIGRSPGNTLMAYLIQLGLLTGGEVQVTVTDPGGDVLASGAVTAQ